MTRLSDWCYRKTWKYVDFIAVLNWSVWGIGFRITRHWDGPVYWEIRLGPLNLWSGIGS